MKWDGMGERCLFEYEYHYSLVYLMKKSTLSLLVISIKISDTSITF
jgi:hypothetical protein